MHRAQNPNLDILEAAVEQLGPLADEMVFLGGCATGLLLTDPAAPPIRATRDVDAIVELASLSDYHRLSEQLRDAGFAEDASDDAPVCRWTCDGILLDIMPTDERVLGFGNRWYRDALEHATEAQLPSEATIRRVTAPYFLATKLAAFAGRGRGDFMMSHDIEDLIAVLDGRAEILEDVQQCDPSLRTHLAERFQALLDDAAFVDALPGHLPGDAASQARFPLVVDRIKAISEMG
jgi:predicted nucleotidyltransferase